MKPFLLTLSVGAVALAGCTMIPKYDRPAAPVAATWPSGPAFGTNTSPAAVPAAELGWREFFQDPRLVRLIELALTNNRDLRIAELNVEVSRAQYRIQRSALLPTIDGGGAYRRARVPADLSGSGQPVTSSLYSANVGITAYELDLFGRIRSLNQQAIANYLATSEARLNVQISLIAEVAIQHQIERALDEQLAVARKTLQAVETSYDLNRRSFEQGVISELDLRTSEAQVQTAKANLATIAQSRAQAENALVLLVGQSLPADLPPPGDWKAQPWIADLPAGLPSDLLTRRPDILEAEYQLKAANANIGAARAAFFPRVLLTAAAGQASLRLEDLFTGAAGAWSFSPQITVPLFDAGFNKANLDVTKLRKLVQVANYERAIQTAFREVADALAARRLLEERIGAQEQLVKTQQARYNLAEMRYRNGIDSYLNVLLAQEDLYNAQQSLIQSQASRFATQVTLYKALGGGWKADKQQAKS